MGYIFNFENKERSIQFNREKLLLAALQKNEQLYYMMDTQYEGIYQAEAVQRRRLYGSNSDSSLLEKSAYRFLEKQKPLIMMAFAQLARQKISVFRRGFYFYTEIDYEDLVPGDVVFLSAGDVVPSDLRIVFSRNLVVDQSIYTDSAQGIVKVPAFDGAKVRLEQITSLPNICFVASTVVEGLARGVVLSTGKSTYLSHLLLM